jgi:hypothetical protein
LINAGQQKKELPFAKMIPDIIILFQELFVNMVLIILVLKLLKSVRKKGLMKKKNIG